MLQEFYAIVECLLLWRANLCISTRPVMFYCFECYAMKKYVDGFWLLTGWGCESTWVVKQER